MAAALIYADAVQIDRLARVADPTIPLPSYREAFEQLGEEWFTEFLSPDFVSQQVAAWDLVENPFQISDGEVTWSAAVTRSGEPPQGRGSRVGPAGIPGGAAGAGAVAGDDPHAHVVPSPVRGHPQPRRGALGARGVVGLPNVVTWDAEERSGGSTFVLPVDGGRGSHSNESGR